MKRIFFIMFALLLLAGCSSNPQETTVPETTVAITEPAMPWIETSSTPWDSENGLWELSLTISGSLKYGRVEAFDGDILLWNVDDHRGDVFVLELCLVDLDTGMVVTACEFDFAEYVFPQIFKDRIFVCDNTGRTVLELNKDLICINQWEIPVVDGISVVGDNERLYVHEWTGLIKVIDLNTGVTESLLDDDIYVNYINSIANTVNFEYYHQVTGEKKVALLNLESGEVLSPAMEKNYNSLRFQNGTWLCDVYRDGYTYYVGDINGQFIQADLGYDSLQLIDGETLLRSREDGRLISVHNLDGSSVCQAVLTENPYSYHCNAVIPSNLYGGYFLIIEDQNNAFRLLYWDTSSAKPGEDIPFESIPEPEEAELRIRQRVEEIEIAYGLDILVGEDCGTVFMDFNASQVTDWDLVDDALDTLEVALEEYPEGFFRQLRYDTVRGIQIHLAGTLTATNSEYADTYEAFVQDNYDSHLMVVDISLADEGTYYHEFSHIIDSFLEWDAMNREDALFNEDTWCALNPSWFPGYTYDYSWEEFVQDYSCFVDAYSTINPTEDRARVLEYAMADYGSWTFEGCEVLTNKLDYYCRCIRDAFDTTGWPEMMPWEQYLP